LAKNRDGFGWALLVDNDGIARLQQRNQKDPLHASRIEEGLDWAAELARNRQDLYLKPQLRTEGVIPMTPDDLAERHDLDACFVRASITQARKFFFGSLSDSGIRERHRQARRKASRPLRVCDEPGCENELPLNATSRRRYCDEHLSGAARIARHRSRSAL
jgi:hypothetical protein